VALGEYAVTAGDMIAHSLDAAARELGCDAGALRDAAERAEERRVA
jgi:predicted amidohydrolase